MLLLSASLPKAVGVTTPRANGDLGALGSETFSCAAGVEVIGALLRGTKIGLSIFMAPHCAVATAFQCVSFRSVVLRESAGRTRSSVRLRFLCISGKTIRFLLLYLFLPLINGAVDVVAKALLLRRCC